MWRPLLLAPPLPGSASQPLPLAFVAADPWSPNPYIDLKGNHTYLSFPNAVKSVSETLAVMSVPAALGVAVSGANHADFAARLAAFGEQFALPFFQRLARRAQAMETLETTKWELVQPQPSANSMDISGLPRLKALRRADVLQAASNAAGAFASSTPLANLTAFAAEKTAHAAQVAIVQSEAAQGLGGAVLNGWRFYAEGDVASSLLSGHPGHEYTLTALLVFFGTPAQLALPASIFGFVP